MEDRKGKAEGVGAGEQRIQAGSSREPDVAI